VSRRKTRRPGEITIPLGSGFDKGRKCTCWPKSDDARPGTPQTCDWRCRACRIHGRPFYSRGDLQYLEHGTGPLAAELDRLAGFAAGSGWAGATPPSPSSGDGAVLSGPAGPPTRA
jgi:hypothetical protein